MPWKDKEVFRKAQKEYQRKYRLQWRKWVIDQFGGKCMQCGFSDYRALHIDHINGDGKTDPAYLRGKGQARGIPYMSKTLAMHIVSHPEKYQLLCANCNNIKEWERRLGSQEHAG